MDHRNSILKILAFSLFTFSIGCSSKLILQSEPSDAEIFLGVAGKEDKTKAGVTPLELTETQLKDLLKISSDQISLMEVVFKKKDFEDLRVMMPSNRWGEMSKTVKVQLTPRTEASDTVRVILKHLFNAKKFTDSRQYDQAHAEIDKALTLDSKMTQAMTMKGSVYFLQANYIEAQNWYKKAIDTDPSSSEAIQMLERIQSKRSGGAGQ